MCQRSPALVRAASLRIAFIFLFSFFNPLGAPGQVPQEQSASIDGSYTFVQDSNGGKAPANLRITLKLANGTAVLFSSPSQPMYSDRGSYEFQGGVLKRFVLPLIGKFVANKPASLQAESLTLPFMLLSPGAGTSTWQAPQVAVAHLPANVATLIDQIIARMDLRIPPQVRNYLMQSITPGRNQAAQYMRLGTALNFAGQIPEAIWALAHAAKLLPDTHILSNLGHVLSLDADYAEARTILLAAHAASPENHFILNNLAYANYQQDKFEQAEMAERKAVALNPEPEYLWSLCKILRAQHKEIEGKKYCDAAVDKGMLFILNPQPKKPDQPQPPSEKPPDEKPPGDQPPPPDEIPPETRPDLKPPEGNEDQGAENAPDADPDETIIGQIGKRDRAHDQKPPEPYNFPSNPQPLAELSKTAANWVGHWEGEKTTGCIHRTRKFGSGMAMTMVKENICHYAQKLSFDVDEKGTIDGQGEAVYVFYGKADNPALMMSPVPLPPGGFFATFQGGYRIRKFKIQGTVMPDGTVSIGGRPEKPLYLLNIYMWQKIYGWNVFPPPPDHPGQPGILKIGKRGTEWTMEGTSHNNVSGMNYETVIYKTSRKFNMVKGCKIYCSKEPMAQSMGIEKKVEEAKCGASAGPIEIKGNGSVIEASAKVSTPGGMNLGEIKVEANYGKPGELEEAMKKEATAGCAVAGEGEGGEEGETPGSVKAHAKVLNFGFSVERNPIAGDETFGLGVIEAEGPKMETEEGGVKAEVTPKASFQLVVNSHCGFGMKWEVKAEVATGAEGEVGETKVGAGCSKEVSVEGTAWAGSNIVD